MEAVERFGVVRGGLMACARVLRCHPFVRGGYDPIIKPEPHCEAAIHESIEGSSRPYHRAILGQR